MLSHSWSRTLRFLIVLLGFFAVGAFVYWDCSYRAARGEFPPGAATLFGVILMGTWVGPIRLHGRSLSQWTWTLGPAAVFLILDWASRICCLVR